MARNDNGLMAAIVIAALLAVAFFGCQGAETSDTAADSAAAAPETKPGFVTEVEDGRLWVLRPGEEKSEKHITLVGAGPNGMTIKALERKTALEYIATKPGFKVEVDEDGRIWVFRTGEPAEKSEKHITRVGAGPMGSTLKALDRETLDAYLDARS